MSRLPQAGPTSDRLQKRGEQRRGAEDHDPKCEPWQKRDAAIPRTRRKTRRTASPDPRITVVRIRAREVVCVGEC